MSKFIVTQNEINIMFQDLREAPAKYSFRALQVLNNLRPLDNEKEENKGND